MFHRHKFHGQMSDTFRAAFCVILSGGFQDAYTYFCRGEVFANAQTGNIVLLSTALFRREWLTAPKYIIPLVSFALGTAAAEFIHLSFKKYTRIHWRQIILFCEILLLFCVGFLGQKLDPLANALVSFVCAMQVQTFHKVQGHSYASTMCIGNLRCGTEALCDYFLTKEKKALHTAVTYFSVILVFAIGAGLGSFLTGVLGVRAIWISCALLAVSFFMMFEHD